MNDVALVSSPVPLVPAARATPMSFVGQAGEFFGMVLRGSLLLLPTLGFYRFWLITDIRRHLWAHTRVGGDAFEYNGTGRELLIGFLIALAVLAPVYVGYFIVGLAAETLQAFASIPLGVILYVFGHYAIYRARRYRATRTIFRGLRFWMAGSAWRYAGKAILWDLATLLTLGLAYPWRMAALERYKMRNTRFGDLAGDFVGRPGTFFRRGIWLWLFAVAGPVAWLLATVALVAAAQPNSLTTAAFLAPLGLVTLALLLMLPILYPLFRAVQMRWQMEGIRFGEVALTSTLAKKAVLVCYLKLIGALLGWGFIGAGFVGAVTQTFWQSLEGLKAGSVTPGGIAVIVGFAILYLVFLLGVGVLKRYFLDRGLWVLLVGSATVLNFEALDHVAGQGEAAGSLGEGLADALDVGGF
jgi:uncharacterized membrane protein YjgN (DUF898 family)